MSVVMVAAVMILPLSHCDLTDFNTVLMMCCITDVVGDITLVRYFSISHCTIVTTGSQFALAAV